MTPTRRRRRRAIRSGAALAFSAALALAGCTAPRTYDRGESIGTTLEVMFGDPEEDAADLSEDIASIFRRAERDADEFPEALASFASFFY